MFVPYGVSFVMFDSRFFRTLCLSFLSIPTLWIFSVNTMAQAPSNPGREEPAAEDPYEWLEEVLGDKALEWVKARNAIVQNRMEREESFEKLRSDLLEILDSNARIPFVSKRGEYYYNFWRDKTNERGLWRRTTLEEYRKAEPKWEVVLDLDALGKTENENWVWKGASLLRPDYQRALITLSRGGADANITREFDLKTRSFVADGFELPESKGSVSWIDIDHLFVSTDFGDGSMTDSGYPRMAKLWKRGTPIEQANLVYEGKQEDMSVGAVHDDSPGFERNFVTRNIAFYNDELFLVKDSGELVKIDAPNTASKSVFKQYLLLELREAWTLDSKTYPAGSLLVSDFDRFLRGERVFEVLFEPSANTALSSVTTTKDHVVINVLEDVKNRLYVLTPSTTESPAAWRREPLVGATAFGTVNVTAVDSDDSNDYFMTSTDYLTPTTLSIGTIGKVPEELKRLPHFFDSVGMQISQHFATSSDGTKVPYFMVAKKDVNLDGKNPTLLYGYGGFEISLQPNYSATVGRAWLTQGGVYVVANIRGGGEYGPRWHQAALKENRLRAYEDFAAVAKDLVARGVTSKQRLGIQGGSNGGLLVGNMITLYPELFEAGVCQVPLLDMKRYNKLLAGASWMAEYGNPDYPDQWAYIRKFSPYQNVQPSVAYPKVLFTTSTRDDRVHPGHARKMMAKMESQGHAVWYYENIEGGHGGAANNKQSAFMQALAYTFLKQELMK
jgi:prolyl oligopeptidase